MVEGENLALTLSIQGYDISQCTVVATLQGKNRQITKTNNDMILEGGEDGTLITLKMTQLDSLALGAGAVTVQLNWIDSTGLRRATRKATFSMEENLYKRVMKFDDE